VRGSKVGLDEDWIVQKVTLALYDPDRKGVVRRHIKGGKVGGKTDWTHNRLTKRARCLGEGIHLNKRTQ